MSGFDRSAFRGASSSRRKQQMAANEEQTSYQGGGEKTNRRVYNKLKKGKNYLRIFPIHPKTLETLGFDLSSNMYPKTGHYLDTLVKYTKNGEAVEEIQRRQHLSSKVHGGTEKCLIDEYISFSHKVAYDEIQDEDERTKFLSPIKNWQTGIMGKTKWAAFTKMYKDKSKEEFERGITMVPVSVVNKMNELSADDDDAEDVMETDIFSDPDDGLVMIITSDPEAGKSDPSKYYQVAPDYKGGADPLTDEDLEWLMEQKPLNEMYVDIYTRKDFFNALNALKAFDEKNDLGIFSYDAFLDIVEEISNYYPEVDEEEQKEKGTITADEAPRDADIPEKEKVVEKSKKVEEKSDLPFDKELEEMEIEDLKSYIRRNGLSIRVLPSYSKEQVIQFIREEEDIIAQEKEAVEKEEVSTPSTGGRSSRLSALADGLEED